MWDTLRRWRTWIFNIVTGLVILPDLILALAGFNWGVIVPLPYMPYVTLSVLVINVLMRPRKAVLPKDVR